MSGAGSFRFWRNIIAKIIIAKIIVIELSPSPTIRSKRALCCMKLHELHRSFEDHLCTGASKNWGVGLHDISHAIFNQAVDNEHGFAQLVSEQRLCVVNAAPCEITHVMEIYRDYRTGFTDKMRIKYRMHISCSPTEENLICLLLTNITLNQMSAAAMMHFCRPTWEFASPWSPQQ